MNSIHSVKYQRNRDRVRRMSMGLCERCYHLYGRVTPAKECDHLIARSHGGTNDIDNLWMLCGSRNDPGTCHFEKSGREKSKRFDVTKPFHERINPNTGWPMEGDTLENWQAYIKKRNAVGSIYLAVKC